MQRRCNVECTLRFTCFDFQEKSIFYSSDNGKIYSQHNASAMLIINYLNFYRVFWVYSFFGFNFLSWFRELFLFERLVFLRQGGTNQCLEQGCAE